MLKAILTDHTQFWLALAAIVLASTIVVWLVLVPDQPEVALGDSLAAALFASIVLLGKSRHDRWQK